MFYTDWQIVVCKFFELLIQMIAIELRINMWIKLTSQHQTQSQTKVLMLSKGLWQLNRIAGLLLVSLRIAEYFHQHRHSSFIWVYTVRRNSEEQAGLNNKDGDIQWKWSDPLGEMKAT